MTGELLIARNYIIAPLGAALVAEHHFQIVCPVLVVVAFGCIWDEYILRMSVFSSFAKDVFNEFFVLA